MVPHDWADGRVMGGAMFYLQNGLAEVAERTGGVIFKPLGKFLAVAFAILCIGGSFGGGNTFQVNQSLNAFRSRFLGLVITAGCLV